MGPSPKSLRHTFDTRGGSGPPQGRPSIVKRTHLKRTHRGGSVGSDTVTKQRRDLRFRSIPYVTVLCYNDAMSRSRAILFSVTIGSTLVFPIAYAAQPFIPPPIDMGAFGSGYTIGGLANDLINLLAGAIVSISATMFIVGAFCIVLSAGKESLITRGKDLMIGSLIGMGVVLGAYAIFRTALYVFYFI